MAPQYPNTTDIAGNRYDLDKHFDFRTILPVDPNPDEFYFKDKDEPQSVDPMILISRDIPNEDMGALKSVAAISPAAIIIGIIVVLALVMRK